MISVGTKLTSSHVTAHREDIENHYLDLKSVGSGGAFVACTDCNYCSTYASTAVSIR